ncbi:MAG: CRISPR-associated endonuclease Cas1, partial [Dehalococcoidia bacterium]|nr:CRISPR-associated endonuclease Cas1 [Dehalococcoidia bacterium]
MPNLYVTEPGARIEKEYGRLQVTSRDGDLLMEVPVNRVENVILLGNVGVTTPALSLLMDCGVGLIFLTSSGKFRGRLQGDLSKNVFLRQAQYEHARDGAFCLEMARSLVRGKLSNQRTLCLRLDETETDERVVAAAVEMRSLAQRLNEAPDLASQRACEARGAKVYFSVLRCYLRQGWDFPRRKRRPASDPVNALLSLAYTFLHQCVFSAIEAVGLDPHCGFYHALKYGRPALALDLMEEFRPLVADSVVLTLINKR